MRCGSPGGIDEMELASIAAAVIGCIVFLPYMWSLLNELQR